MPDHYNKKSCLSATPPPRFSFTRADKQPSNVWPIRFLQRRDEAEGDGARQAVDDVPVLGEVSLVDAKGNRPWRNAACCRRGSPNRVPRLAQLLDAQSRVRTRLSAGGSRIRTRGPALRRAPLTRRATRSPSRLAGESGTTRGGEPKVRIRFLRRLGNFHVGRTRQITNSWETLRTSTSKSRPCTGGRAKCQVKPPDMAARRTNSSARSGWMSKMV